MGGEPSWCNGQHICLRNRGFQVRVLARAQIKMQNLKFKSQNLVFLIVFLFFLFLSLFPNQAEAAIVPCGGCAQWGPNPSNPDQKICLVKQLNCQFCHIFVLIANIVDYVLTVIVPIVAGLMIIIGGLYLLAAGASPETLGKAKSVITATVIGLVIIFLAWVFLNTLLDFMDIKTWTGLEKWWEFTDKCPVR